MGGLGALNARGRWYYERSRERFLRRPDAWAPDLTNVTEIGAYEGIRFIVRG